MSIQILDAMARGGFEEVIALHDGPSRLRGFLAIHDTSRGPAFGGIRRLRYRDESEAVRDSLRLARAMTRKCALAELPAGGAKLVIDDRPDLDLERGYRYLGEVVERLGGRFYTGPDMGTDDRELEWVSSATRFVTRPDEPGELAESTGLGVLYGMEAALEHVFGEVDWPRRTVIVQGLGKVGAFLARELVARGARVLGCDVESDRAQALAQELEIELCEPSELFSRECDVLSPNAVGGILHDVSLARLACRIVCGAANNILASPEHGHRLHEREILFVPDFVVGAGALIRGALWHLQGERVPPEEIGRRVGAILERVLDLSRESQAPPAKVALELADGIVQGGRESARVPN